MSLSSITYPFDPTGVNQANLVSNDQQIVTANNYRDYYFVIPKFGPFFIESMVVTHSVNGVSRVMVQGVEYAGCLPFIGATRSIGKIVYGAISFTDPTITGVVSLRYQTLGGDYLFDDQKVLETIANRAYNPRITTFEQVTNQPTLFPPTNHQWNLIDLVGQSSVVEALVRIEQAILTRVLDAFRLHVTRMDNPHNDTKESLGLGLVENFPPATLQEATALVATDRLITPKTLGAVLVNYYTTAEVDLLIDRVNKLALSSEAGNLLVKKPDGIYYTVTAPAPTAAPTPAPTAAPTPAPTPAPTAAPAPAPTPPPAPVYNTTFIGMSLTNSSLGINNTNTSLSLTFGGLVPNVQNTVSFNVLDTGVGSIDNVINYITATTASVMADSAGNGNLMLRYGASNTDLNGASPTQRTIIINAYGTTLNSVYSFNYGTVPAPTPAPSPTPSPAPVPAPAPIPTPAPVYNTTFVGLSLNKSLLTNNNVSATMQLTFSGLVPNANTSISLNIDSAGSGVVDGSLGGAATYSVASDSAGNGSFTLSYTTLVTPVSGQKTIQISAYGSTLTSSYSYIYQPASGTQLGQHCSGTTLIGTYADGVGGSYDSIIENNSTTCGYVPPPPAASITDFHVSPNPTNYGDPLQITIVAANLKSNAGYTIATFYKNPANGFNYVYTFPGNGFNSDGAGNLNASHASSSLFNGYSGNLTVYIAEGVYSFAQMQDVGASGIASSIVLQAQTPLTINYVDQTPASTPTPATGGGADGAGSDGV